MRHNPVNATQRLIVLIVCLLYFSRVLSNFWRLSDIKKYNRPSSTSTNPMLTNKTFNISFEDQFHQRIFHKLEKKVWQLIILPLKVIKTALILFTQRMKSKKHATLMIVQMFLFFWNTDFSHIEILHLKSIALSWILTINVSVIYTAAIPHRAASTCIQAANATMSQHPPEKK